MKSNEGLTLIEILISLVIAFIVFLGMSGAGIFVLNENIKNSERDEAVSVAEMEIQDARNIPFATLADDTHSVSRPIRGLNVQYTVTRTVATLDAQNKQVTITVAWTRLENNQSKTYTHRVISIARP